MSGVPVSPELRERARKGLQYVYKKIEKDADVIEVFELQRAYMQSENNAEEYVKIINNRIRELDDNCHYYVLSDTDEKRLRLIYKRDEKTLSWCIFVYSGMTVFVNITFKKNLDYLKKSKAILKRNNHMLSSKRICQVDRTASEFLTRAKQLVEKHPQVYLRTLHQMYSNDLTRFVLKSEGNLQKMRMQLHLKSNEKELDIGPSNLIMPYCRIPEFLKQFPKSIVPMGFLDLCRALALVCHNSEYGKQQASQFAQEQERDLKRLKTSE